MLLDYRGSFALSVAVDVPAIRAYRHSGSCWANSNTDANFFGAGRHCGVYACRCDYCEYVLHGFFLSVVKPTPTVKRTEGASHCSDRHNAGQRANYGRCEVWNNSTWRLFCTILGLRHRLSPGLEYLGGAAVGPVLAQHDARPRRSTRDHEDCGRPSPAVRERCRRPRRRLLRCGIAGEGMLLVLPDHRPPATRRIRSRSASPD